MIVMSISSNSGITENDAVNIISAAACNNMTREPRLLGWFGGFLLVTFRKSVYFRYEATIWKVKPGEGSYRLAEITIDQEELNKLK